MHEVDALWLRIERPMTRIFAAPSSLMPIAGPETEPVEPEAPREREPEPEAA